jgi:hypothetical protein
VVSALAIEKRDADFYSVRTTNHKDMSGRKGDPKGKYFRESALRIVACSATVFHFSQTLANKSQSIDESVYVFIRAARSFC